MISSKQINDLMNGKQIDVNTSTDYKEVQDMDNMVKINMETSDGQTQEMSTNGVVAIYNSKSTPESEDFDSIGTSSIGRINWVEMTVGLMKLISHHVTDPLSRMKIILIANKAIMGEDME